MTVQVQFFFNSFEFYEKKSYKSIANSFFFNEFYSHICKAFGKEVIPPKITKFINLKFTYKVNELHSRIRLE
jgi:hypothetical protein